MLGANLSGEVDVFRFRSSGFLVCCVSNASRSALPGKPEFSGGGGWVVVEGKVSGGGMKQSVSFLLEPHRLPGEQPPPPSLFRTSMSTRGKKKKKGMRAARRRKYHSDGGAHWSALPPGVDSSSQRGDTPTCVAACSLFVPSK